MDEVWTGDALHRGAVAVVDLDAIAHNVRRVREVAPSAGVMAVVKADAYGHGAVPSARAALRGGASWLATAYVEEALALRDAGIEAPVLALVTAPGADYDAAVRHRVDVSVSTPAVLAEVAAAARRAGAVARVHLEADTGLSRGGAAGADWDSLTAAVAAAPEVECVGVWSHFACADEPGHPSIARQLERYADACDVAAAAGLQPEVRHMANSAATFTLPDARFDLVRPGIALYGVAPGGALGSARELGLQAAMTVQARLALVKRVPAGEGVSYGHAYVTPRDTVLGLVPLGYGDGIPRAGSGVGPVRTPDGGRTTVAGRVCMDQLVVDLGPDSAARAGDVVVLVGEEADGASTAADWGEATGSIGYEIVTRIGHRVPRVHRGGTS